MPNHSLTNIFKFPVIGETVSHRTVIRGTVTCRTVRRETVSCETITRGTARRGIVPTNKDDAYAASNVANIKSQT